MSLQHRQPPALARRRHPGLGLFGVAQRVAALCTTLALSTALAADEPPAVNPFGPRETGRADAMAGYAELSDGTIYPGRLYLTRDARLKIYDADLQRQRELPLHVIRRIECQVKKQWMEKQWRFKENANDQKVYTGRAYPAREYVHQITLRDGRRITGPMSGILYVQASEQGKAVKLLMHKRQKGPIDAELESLVYLRLVELGDEAFESAKLRAQQQRQQAARGKRPANKTSSVK